MTPRFCKECRSTLVRQETVQYDEYTGDIKNSIIILECPRRGKDDTHSSFQWMGDNNSGQWLPLDSF